MFDDSDDFVDKNEIEHSISLFSITSSSEISRNSKVQSEMISSASRITLQSMRVNASKRNQIEKNEKKNDFDEVKNISRQLIESRKSERIRILSQRTLKNIRFSINLFKSDQISKIHVHMIRVLIILTRNENNENLDESLILKKTMFSSH